MAGEIWLIIASRFRRLRGVKDHQEQPVAAEPPECDACGKTEKDGKLAQCSTCGGICCAGECFTLHKPRGRHAA